MKLHDPNASFRLNQEGLKKFLGDLECEIMEIVWFRSNPTITVREVYDVIKKERSVAYTTIMTTMNRLYEKDMLKLVGKIGLANCFSPVMTKEKYIKSAVELMLKVINKDFNKEYKDYLEKQAVKKKR